MPRNVDLTFDHSWTAEMLDRAPMIVPARQFIYPQRLAEDAGARDDAAESALLISVRPRSGGPWFGAFAMGFADESLPHGIWACPGVDWMCAVAGGYAYMVNTIRPNEWHQISYQPVLSLLPLPKHQLLLLESFTKISAWGSESLAWESARLSWEGLRVSEIRGDELHGFGWDLLTDTEVPFVLDLRSGEHHGGAAPA